jgi:1-piperideine-2-carboxylate/1-pyrroline-2-carboxylate reductase [NAD(P)H]
MTTLLDAAQTAARLPYAALLEEIGALLADDTVRVPERLVQPLPGGGSLFVMPALDAAVAMTKLITFTPANAGSSRPTIQGDVVVFDTATGERLLILHGPTVTARRTAAVSVLAAQRLAPDPDGALLVVGAGAQGFAHLDAFAQMLALRRVFVASASAASAQSLVGHARAKGLNADSVADPRDVLDECALVVTCTPANRVVLSGRPRDDAFIAAVGAFTPQMVELDAGLCQECASHGRIVVDTPQARHEAGDLLQAGLDPANYPTLRDVVLGEPGPRTGPVLFKSCGWAGWDLAAARCAVRHAGGVAT